MKPWNASRLQAGHSGAAKAVARRVRDWLNGFLDEPGDSVVGQRDASSDPSATPAITRGADERGPEPVSAREEETGMPAWNELNLPGPPEDWLRRVREGAPGLLLSAEEGGTPWLGPPPRPEIGNDEAQREMTSAPTEPVRNPQASPVFEEPRAAPAQTSPARPAPRKNAWQHLKRQFVPAALARRAEGEKQRRQEPPATTGREREGPVASARAGPKLAGEVRSPQALRGPAIESRHAVGPPIRSAATVAPRWTERVKKRIQAALQIASENRSTSMAPAESRKSQRPNPSSAVTPLRGTRTSAGQAGSEVDRMPSQPAVTFRTFERSSKPGGQDRSPAMPHWPVRKAPASLINSRTMPSSARAQDLAKRTRESAETATRIEKGASRTNELRAIQPADPWTTASAHSLKSERADPWPDLPEGQARSTSDWTQVQRIAEHLRALDVEQRGGR